MTNTAAGAKAGKKPSTVPDTPAPIGESDMLTAAEIAADLRVDIDTVRRWIGDRQLPAYKIGRAFRVRRHDVELFLGRRMVGGDTR